MSGDIQNVQGIPAVDRAVEMIRRKNAQLDPGKSKDLLGVNNILNN